MHVDLTVSRGERATSSCSNPRDALGTFAMITKEEKSGTGTRGCTSLGMIVTINLRLDRPAMVEQVLTRNVQRHRQACQFQGQVVMELVDCFCWLTCGLIFLSVRQAFTPSVKLGWICQYYASLLDTRTMHWKPHFTFPPLQRPHTFSHVLRNFLPRSQYSFHVASPHPSTYRSSEAAIRAESFKCLITLA